VEAKNFLIGNKNKFFVLFANFEAKGAEISPNKVIF